jgi:hypothetical protein
VVAEVAMTEVQRTYPLGVSRPDLAVADLPTPEEVFNVRRIGPRELVVYAIGPSLIALGVSIGSGEWLLGPQAVGQFGFVGVGWVILISALLQTFYNVECARYIVATGETATVGWGRVPPGKMFWVPLSAFIVIFAFIAGGWAASAGQGLFALVNGRVAEAGEMQQTRWYAIGLLIVVFFIGGSIAAGRRANAPELPDRVRAADRALEQARASDRGWDRDLLERAARAALDEHRPGEAWDLIELELVDDRPGMAEDAARLVATGPGGSARVVLARTEGGQWYAERVE